MSLVDGFRYRLRALFTASRHAQDVDREQRFHRDLVPIGTVHAQEIRGRVLDPDGHPIARAELQLLLGGPLATTDSSGAFDFGVLSDGHYTIIVRRLGFQPTTVRLTVPMATPRLSVTLMPVPVNLDTVRSEALEKDLPRVFERMREHLGAVEFGADLMKKYSSLSMDEILQTDSKLWPFLRSSSFCGMRVYIDGDTLPTPLPTWGREPPTIVPDKHIREYVKTSDIAAVEVFRSLKQKIYEPFIAPDQAEGCTSIVLIWTKGYEQTPWAGH